MVGLAVSRQGELLPREELAPREALFDFVPIGTGELGANGEGRREKATVADSKFVIEIKDTANYLAGMMKAFRSFWEGL